MTAENNHSSRFDESEYVGASLQPRCRFVYPDGSFCDLSLIIHNLVLAHLTNVLGDDELQQLHQFEAGDDDR